MVGNIIVRYFWKTNVENYFGTYRTCTFGFNNFCCVVDLDDLGVMCVAQKKMET